MGTIEQAAKRLQQLKQAGVEVEAGIGDRNAPSEGPKSDAVPLRVVKELEERAAAMSAAGPHESGTASQGPAPASHPEQRAVRPAERSGLRVEIDLAWLSANGYVTPHAPRSRLAEEFRVIKQPLLTNVRGRAASPVSNANRIMITSSLPGEGKTYTALNLAISLAMDVDTHVLLVDADALRPAVVERLGLSASKGLLDLLVEPDLDLESVVLSTNVDRLSILPAGTPHGQATELLASDAMNRLIERIAPNDTRRIVVFDTPPLLAASESRVLAAHMGQVIMVIAADDTPQGTVAEALATVENCPVVLMLLNRVSPSDRGHYYGSYGAYAH